MPFKNKHPLYSCWKSMKSRCNNPNNISYHRYGGRGIKVCDRWQHDFHTFASDMGERPIGLTLERIDNEKGYSPDNCKWATRRDQQLNRNCVNKLEINGALFLASELARKVGIKSDTIVNRHKRGLSIDEILTPNKLHDLSGLRLGGDANGARQRAKTHCPSGHEYTESNVSLSKLGHRRCRTCHALKSRADREKAKANK